MKYLVFLLTLTSLTQITFGQDKLLFDKYKFDTSYKIIAVSSYNEDKKVYYKELSFYLNNLTDINKVKASVKYGKEVDIPTTDENTLSIYIIKGKEIQDVEIRVNPSYSNIFIDGKSYEFNISQLKALNKQYPPHWCVSHAPEYLKRIHSLNEYTGGAMQICHTEG